MKINIRIAKPADADSFVFIKDQLPLRLSDGGSSTGGFLLGTDRETYIRYIENDFCLIAEKEKSIIGFGIILKDETLKSSDIWQRRHHAKWTIDIEQYEHKKICYFEQLAFLKGHSRDVLKLAFNLVCRAFENGHMHLLTTTVKEPVVNLAAVPFILKGSGTKIGNIHESYPVIGAINSDIYKVDAASMYRAVEASALFSFLKRNYISFA